MPSRQTQQGAASGDQDIEAGELQDGNVLRQSKNRRSGHGRTHSRTHPHIDPDAGLPPGPERLAVTSQLHPFWMTKVGFFVAVLVVLAIVGGIVGGVIGGRSNGGGAGGNAAKTTALSTSSVETSSHSTQTTVSPSRASLASVTG